MMPQFITPEWVKHAVFYQIFPDRFASSSRVIKPGNLEPWEDRPSVYGFKGGDLLGIVEKLDYLQDLGITALYLNPIFQSASNHRYHTHDYYQVDPLLGGNAAFDELLQETHRRGMRIVLDGVFNHASRGFFQFNHILEMGASSPFADWFTIYGYPLNAYGPGNPNYDCWVGLPPLPKFNTRNPQVRQFIFDVARYWIEKGIDGWRLDVPFEIKDDDFWREFRYMVKSINPEAYLVGEIPWEAQHWLAGDQFDGVMNYQFTQACLGFFGGDHINRELEKGMMGLPATPELDAASFLKRLDELVHLYPKEAVLAQLNSLDSHDMPRFFNLAGNSVEMVKFATLVQMTYPGTPCIYYGDEIGLKNGPSRIPEDCRFGFPWDTAQWDHELLGFFKRCIALRKTYPSLRVGSFKPLFSNRGFIAYGRQLNQETLVVVINSSDKPRGMEIPLAELAPDQQGKTITGLLYQLEARVMANHLTCLTLPTHSVEVFKVSP